MSLWSNFLNLAHSGKRGKGGLAEGKTINISKKGKQESADILSIGRTVEVSGNMVGAEAVTARFSLDLFLIV